MKGRFAPSPTGHMHVGNLWVAFLSYWSARRQDGEYIVRIEDVDTQRSKPMYADHILEDLKPIYKHCSQPGDYILVTAIELGCKKLAVLLIKAKHIMYTMAIV